MASARQLETVEIADEQLANTVVEDSAGLGVRRFFTIPGRDPFDEIEWETRDTLIPGKDGPAFEQKENRVSADTTRALLAEAHG